MKRDLDSTFDIVVLSFTNIQDMKYRQIWVPALSINHLWTRIIVRRTPSATISSQKKEIHIPDRQNGNLEQTVGRTTNIKEKKEYITTTFPSYKHETHDNKVLLLRKRNISILYKILKKLVFSRGAVRTIYSKVLVYTISCLFAKKYTLHIRDYHKIEGTQMPGDQNLTVNWFKTI